MGILDSFIGWFHDTARKTNAVFRRGISMPNQICQFVVDCMSVF